MILSILNETVGFQNTLQFKFFCEGVLTYRTTIGNLDEHRGILHYEIDFIMPETNAGVVFTEYDDLSGHIPSEQIGPSYISDFEILEIREFHYSGHNSIVEAIYRKDFSND
tara:strand:+ start:2050 stop:2382 length:333 start_codon:yes stop_codon:yes gene_type:complete